MHLFLRMSGKSGINSLEIGQASGRRCVARAIGWGQDWCYIKAVLLGDSMCFNWSVGVRRYRNATF